jgi:hypothetical protein
MLVLHCIRDNFRWESWFLNSLIDAQSVPDCCAMARATDVSGNGLGFLAWMKMMQLMVNRRQAPDKKSSLVNEALNDGVAAFALDGRDAESGKPQQSRLKHPPRRKGKDAELPESLPSSRSFGDGAVNGDCEAEAAAAQRRSHRRHSRTDATQLESIRLGPTLATSLAFSRPENLSADEKFAYISLDGRLINAELATSATSIGGRLGEQEAQAWQDFAPLQRVLIVAVSAAAAAAAKHSNRKEIDLLLKTVENRVHCTSSPPSSPFLSILSNSPLTQRHHLGCVHFGKTRRTNSFLSDTNWASSASEAKRAPVVRFIPSHWKFSKLARRQLHSGSHAASMEILVPRSAIFVTLGAPRSRVEAAVATVL